MLLFYFLLLPIKKITIAVFSSFIPEYINKQQQNNKQTKQNIFPVGGLQFKHYLNKYTFLVILHTKMWKSDEVKQKHW